MSLSKLSSTNNTGNLHMLKVVPIEIWWQEKEREKTQLESNQFILQHLNVIHVDVFVVCAKCGERWGMGWMKSRNCSLEAFCSESPFVCSCPAESEHAF